MNKVLKFFSSLLELARKENALAMKKDASINGLKSFFNFFPSSKREAQK